MFGVQDVDEVTKYRLTGAIIWLAFVVLWVPVWFGDPVYFQPESDKATWNVIERPLVKQPAVQAEGTGVSMPVESPKKVVSSPVTEKELEAPASQWIVRVVAYQSIKAANDLLGRLESQYDVSIKTFEATGMHSVRVGPYSSREEALKVKREIDKALNTQSEVVVSLN